MHATDIIFWLIYIISLYITIFTVFTIIEPSRKKTTQKLSEFPGVTIIIPAYNEENTISGTIKSALELDYPKDKLEIIAVNDGSKDSTLEEMKKYKDNIKIITQINQGKAVALNNGIKHAKFDYVACLDADSFVWKDTLRLMITNFEDPDTSAVCPLMKTKNPKNIIEKAQWLEYILQAFIKMAMSKIHCINVTPGPFTIYRKKDLEEIGGFDPKSIVEDQEIAYRLQSRHKKISQSTEGNVYTVTPKSMTELYRQRRRWNQGTVLTLIKYRSMIFNREYGDFGMFQLPSVAAGMMTIPLIALLIINHTIVPFARQIHRLWLVGFDLTPYLTINTSISQMITTWWLSTDFSKLFIVIILFIVSITLLLKSHKETKEKIKSIEIIPLIFFLLVYYMILIVIWLGSVTELIIGRKKRW